MAEITWDDFDKVDIRVGRVVESEPFPEARKPSIKLVVDFGASIGTRRTSAQLTTYYEPDALVGRLLNLGFKSLVIVLADLVILLELLDDIDAVASHVTNRHLRRFGIFVREFYEFFAALFVQFRNTKPKHLPLGRRRQAEIGIDDRLFNGMH